MNSVLEIIKERISEDQGTASVFVFPSENTASFWAEKALSLFKLKTIAKERFIAWDRFKEKNSNAANKGKKAAGSVTRLLFADYLIRLNKETPFLSYLIPDAYALDGAVFTRMIALMLPSLKLWRAKINAAARGSTGNSGDPALYTEASKHEYEFFTELEKRYENFLEHNFLFEPSWEKPPFRDTEHIYFIFYPSLIDDFCEYEELLDAPHVHKIELPKADQESSLLLYDSSRAELRALILEIRRLYYEEHIAYEEIFVSVPDLKTLEPYIEREFNLYNIPVHVRSGKNLSEYGEALLFSEINNCVQNNFSFSSMRELLFNFSLPWKCPNKNAALMQFGIKNNCVSAYREDGKEKDIWEEAFWGKAKKQRLHNHYKKLKNACKRIARSKSFPAFFKNTHRFTEKFFNEKDQDEHNTVFGRVLRELSSVKEIIGEITENSPDAGTPNPLGFFISVLKEKTHVKDEKKFGVQIFPYGVASAAPARAHFVINASQKHTTKLYRPLNFLRKDSRKALDLKDIDVSADFFKSFHIISELDPNKKKYVYFSASSLTFSGWALPNSYFDRLKDESTGEAGTYIVKAEPPCDDLFIKEKEWWAHCEAKDTECDTAFFGQEIMPAQKMSFEQWLPFAPREDINLFKHTFVKGKTVSTLIQKQIRLTKQTAEILRVSASSLKNFFKCPVFWLLNDVFKVEDYPVNACLLDDAGKGLLYHEILKIVFSMIQFEETESRFDKNNIQKYYLWAEAAAEKAAKSYPAFRGPLARPLIETMAASCAYKIKRLLDREAENFNGWIVENLEKEFKIVYKAALSAKERYDGTQGILPELQDNIILHGFIDRVSLSPDKDSVLIIDYKTGTPPARADAAASKERPLSDFQIAFYIKIYEHCSEKKVGNAAFFSINNNKYSPIVRKDYTHGSTDYSRDVYQKTIDTLDDFIFHYAASVSNLDFIPREVNCDNDDIKPDFSKKTIPLNHCYTCIYKNICRTTFFVNSATRSSDKG
ncbi:MAG: PD-(D/E)XK nuclease family protein [Spirochaetaceae bacterium]|nr:PD-(D/E)XK nuclease family protein [Spirochaetaceae bacterium]